MMAQRLIVQKILRTMKFDQSKLCQFDLGVKLYFFASEIEKKNPPRTFGNDLFSMHLDRF